MLNLMQKAAICQSSRLLNLNAHLNFKINPAALVIKNPGEGYGDNWTSFREPQARFYNLIKQNAKSNKKTMPLVLTNMVSNANDFFWPKIENGRCCTHLL